MKAKAAAQKKAEVRTRRQEAEVRRKIEEAMAADERRENFRSAARQRGEARKAAEKAMIEAQRIAIQQNINKEYRKVAEQRTLTGQREAEERIEAA